MHSRSARRAAREALRLLRSSGHGGASRRPCRRSFRRASTARRRHRSRRNERASRGSREADRRAARRCTALAGRLARADALPFRLLPAPARRDSDQRAAAAPALGEAAAAQGASVRFRAVVGTLRAEPFAQRGSGARPGSDGERAWQLRRVPAARRNRQRKDRGVPAPHCPSSCARRPGAGPGPGDQPDTSARGGVSSGLP